MAVRCFTTHSVTWKSASKPGSLAFRQNMSCELMLDRVDGDLYPNEAGVIAKACTVEVDFAYADTLNGFTNGDSGTLVVVLEAAIGSDPTATVTRAFVRDVRISSDPGVAGTVVFECVSSGDTDPVAWT